jgi:hypothetical protein
MQRVNRSSAVLSLPAPPAGGTPGYFTGGNPGIGQAATVPGFEWFNGVQEELIGMLTRAGITPAQADLTQLRQSLDRLYGGGLRTVAANTTLTADDAGLVLVDASGGARTITLPAASAMNARPMLFRVVKIDASANAVTVQRAGTDTIEGGTSIVINGQWANAMIVSSGVNTWFNAIRPPVAMVLVNRMTTQAIPNVTNTAISWENVQINEVGIYNAGNPTRLTVPVGFSRARFTAGVFWAPNNTGTRNVTIRKNLAGGGFTDIAYDVSPAQNETGRALSSLEPVVAGDFFEMFVSHNVGAALNIGGNNATRFSLELMR